MARSLHVRLDDAASAALDVVRGDGLTDSEAVRTALREAAARRRVRSAIRSEVRALVADEGDREEMRIIREQMAELAPPPAREWSAARFSVCRRDVAHAGMSSAALASPSSFKQMSFSTSARRLSLPPRRARDRRAFGRRSLSPDRKHASSSSKRRSSTRSAWGDRRDG